MDAGVNGPAGLRLTVDLTNRPDPDTATTQHQDAEAEVAMETANKLKLFIVS